ncbi:MAG: CDGSH iron-sulfur domain-containing protein [Coriobacteriia bacterium]|nr:CDGSH iron-sulfur domain-containing protein [Coriobacteriia bacterium]MCL2606931.1 CDGSH iron-sulfur domain-containing protein [Coriobacteriia bacterium]
MSESMRIDVLENGPYMVSGNVPLSVMTIERNEQREAVSWRQIKELPLKDKYMLCRCGKSKNKPYCDGTHAAIGFDGYETATMQPYERDAEVIQGDGIALHDNQSFCVGAEFCDRLGGVWNLVQATVENVGERNPEKATQVVQKAQKIATEQACNCPSGRLVMHKTLDDGSELIIEPDFGEPNIVLIEDVDYGASGAIWVRGKIPIYSADGNPYEVRNRMTLCRCGASSNKPFCNGAHYSINFDDGLVD